MGLLNQIPKHLPFLQEAVKGDIDKKPMFHYIVIIGGISVYPTFPG
jgi:hypothetical protein